MCLLFVVIPLFGKYWMVQLDYVPGRSSALALCSCTCPLVCFLREGTRSTIPFPQPLVQLSLWGYGLSPDRDLGGLQAPLGWEYGWNSWGPFDALLNSEKAHTLSSSYLLKVLWKDLMTKTEELTLVSTASLLFSCSTSFHLGPFFYCVLF